MLDFFCPSTQLIIRASTNLIEFKNYLKNMAKGRYISEWETTTSFLLREKSLRGTPVCRMQGKVIDDLKGGLIIRIDIYQSWGPKVFVLLWLSLFTAGTLAATFLVLTRDTSVWILVPLYVINIGAVFFFRYPTRETKNRLLEVFKKKITIEILPY